MLATVFVSNGVKALKDPEALVPAAEPLAAKFVPLAQRTLPEAVSAYVPEDTKNLVRLNGVASILGGLGMFTNISTRGGGTLAAVSMLPHLIASNPRGAADKKAARSIFLRNLALTGAALVVSQDTKGNPSLGWRANDFSYRMGQQARKRSESLAKDAEGFGKRTRKQLDRSTKDLKAKLP